MRYYKLYKKTEDEDEKTRKEKPKLTEALYYK